MHIRQQLHRHRLAVAVLAMLLIAPVLTAISGPTAASAAAPAVEVGVGYADITPIAGGYKGGWACTCGQIHGQHTRLYARAVVLKSGDTKVALVTVDLFALSGGMVRDAAALLPGRGLSEQNVLASATHTHSSQSGYMNHSAYNTIFPDLASGDSLTAVLGAQLLTPADQTMYNFMTRQLASALRRADDDLAPGAVGWGHTTLLGVTHNRSLEAHLADYGIHDEPGTGKESDDPHGYAGTIDPAVDLLRIDQIRNGHRVPVGVYTTFANHGTVDKANFWYFSADHQGSAERHLSAKISAAAHLPAGSNVVTAFANSDAGDMSSGLEWNGPALADNVGRREASAMFNAWVAAGNAMTTTPTVALRWTRMCMCGQRVDGHATDTTPWGGLAGMAGSEEGRGVAGELGVAREGAHLPVDVGPQGDKITVLPGASAFPKAVPLTVLQIGTQVIASWPGEPTVGVGNALRAALAPVVKPLGVGRVVVAGYAGEYLDYWTTPEEYEMQHYEGGSTVYGEYASPLVTSWLVGLARNLAAGTAAPAPYAYDPNQGLRVTGDSYGSGASAGTVTGQPTAVGRLLHPVFRWTGGANGVDRPVGSALVTIQRYVSGKWTAVTSDLGTQILWSSDANGKYAAQWEPSLSQAAGTYRMVVTAKRYTLVSGAFAVHASTALVPTVVGGKVQLALPAPVVNKDWTWRPAWSPGWTATFLVDGRKVVVSGGRALSVPSGTHVSIPVGGARDAYGNTNAEAVVLR
ncbi:neutral/alkaline non-lysosomal ceramidase N-terminal domain-containing protein [Nocardioides sp. NPDC126508]